MFNNKSNFYYYEDDEFSRHLNAISETKVVNMHQNSISNQKQKENKILDNNTKIELDLKFDEDDMKLFDSAAAAMFIDDEFDFDDDIDDDDDDSNDSSSNNSSDDCSTSYSSLNHHHLRSSSSTTTNESTNAVSSPASNCSTPTKIKLENTSCHQFPATTTSTNKNKKKNMLLLNGLTVVTTKRNSRFNSMGYSSDNPAEKRAFHILSERQRRNDLKKLFENLRVNIPCLSDKHKASKLTILKAAVDHLVEVSNKREKLSMTYDKEKMRNAQLLQHLNALKQQQ
jgi:hypothetical protein